MIIMQRPGKISVFLFLMIFPFVLIFSQTEQYKFRHLTTDDGMPNNFTYKIIKDSKGFIWITTRGGLCRYDGYNIKVFLYDPGDSTSTSNSYHKCNMTEDSAGYLWIGSQHGLNRFDPITETFKRYYHDPENPKSLCGNTVHCVYCDRKGTVWIGGIDNSGLNKYNPETDDFTVYRLYPDDSTNLQVLWGANRVLGMYEDNDGIFWLGTNIGLYQFDRQTGEFIPSKPITPMDHWIDNRFSTITEDEKGKLFYVADWIYSYDRTRDSLGLYQPLFRGSLVDRNQGFMDILLDPNDGGKTIWITKYMYLYKYDRQTGRLDSTYHDPLDSESIIGKNLKGMYMDPSGMIWVAGSSGVNIMVNDSKGIERHTEFAKEYNDEAASFLEDSKGYWWIGTNKSGLLKFDCNMKLISWYKSSLIDNNSDIFFGSIKKIIEDRDQNLWMICNTDRLYFYDRGLDQIKPCKQFKTGRWHPKSIFDIYADSQDVLWIAARPGLYYHKPGDDLNTFHLCKANVALEWYTSSSIVEDHLGNLWIANLGKGLYCQFAKDRGTNEFVGYMSDSEDSTSISNNNIWTVYEDKFGIIWAGTSYGLNRYNRQKNNFERIIFKNNVGANFIFDIMGDENGCLWLSSESGLMRFNPYEMAGNNKVKLKQFIPFKDISGGLLFKDEGGKFYVPAKHNTGNGYFSFHPDSLTENRQIPPIVITDFLIHNNEVKLDSSINIKKHLKLNHNENYISFEFTALDYYDPAKNQYAYMLAGLDQEWIYSENRRFVTYTKIPAGVYTFRVKGSNNYGYWNEEGTSISITILPPPWRTWWAYSLYFMFIFSVLVIIIRFYLRRQRLLHTLELEQIQSEKLGELDKLKSRFFANISHEFRTPLTLILGPVAKHLQAVKDSALKQDLNVVQRNALRLQRLIDQILNLSKIESGKMKLQVREVNIISLVNGYVQSFESLAKQKDIDLIFNSDEENFQLYVDKDKIEKILSNLLSNAFKFTEEGGRIEVTVRSRESEVGSKQSAVHSLQPTDHSPQSSVDCEGNADCQLSTTDFSGLWISITISDTGCGIPPEKLEHIFDRFYQADDSYTRDQEGSGIGLALTKELVKLHYGEITVESYRDGKGSIFTVYLPIGKGHFNQSEIVDQSASEKQNEDFLELYPELTNQKETSLKKIKEADNSKPLLLIVEDNADLLEYIRDYLDKSYNILEAVDGEEGLQEAIKHIPDLVLTDVMMPKMDGFKLCQKLKTDERTSHIPVILLTARASSESKIEGLETGADDYLSKPFDPTELKIRIKNLILQRQKLREKFANDFWKENKLPVLQSVAFGLNQMDKKFLQKALNVVNMHLSDTDFNVVQFGQEMAMSRQQMHRKFRALVNQSATEFIRIIRLKKAADLITQKSGTVSEIAYDVGFNTLSYFTKSFQEQFGITPSEYTEKHPNT